jgi:LPXTG-motif cell wall-anchored protein
MTSYTFLYQPEQEEIIQCVNTYLEWETLITKVDKEDEKKTLPGAVFAIYGEKEGAWNPDWNRYDVERKIERDGTTWHLLDVGVTDEEGNLAFRKLREKKYYLTEVKAPDGYNKEKEGRVIYWRNAVDGILSLQVANAPGTTLPATGGRGIAGIIAAGILCLTASFGYAYKKKRKEKKI